MQLHPKKVLLGLKNPLASDRIVPPLQKLIQDFWYFLNKI